MARLKRGALRLHSVRLTLFGLASCARTLFAEPDDLLLAADAGLHDVRLRRMARCTPRLVQRQTGLVDAVNHHLPFAARMLSTRLGYGRPAALAAALAEDFFTGDNALGLPRSSGRLLAQMGFGFFAIGTPKLHTG